MWRLIVNIYTFLLGIMDSIPISVILVQIFR